MRREWVVVEDNRLAVLLRWKRVGCCHDRTGRSVVLARSATSITLLRARASERKGSIVVVVWVGSDLGGSIEDAAHWWLNAGKA